MLAKLISCLILVHLGLPRDRDVDRDDDTLDTATGDAQDIENPCSEKEEGETRGAKEWTIPSCSKSAMGRAQKRLCFMILLWFVARTWDVWIRTVNIRSSFSIYNIFYRGRFMILELYQLDFTLCKISTTVIYNFLSRLILIVSRSLKSI